MAGEFAGVQFGIAARQPHRVAILRRRLVGERREKGEFSPLRPPSAQKMRIDEGKSRVARDGDFLARRRQGGFCARCCAQGRGQRQHGVEIDMLFDESREGVEPRLQPKSFAGLHEAEMTFRQHDLGLLGQRADHRQARRLDSRLGQQEMARTADLVQHHARDLYARIETSRSPWRSRPPIAPARMRRAPATRAGRARRRHRRRRRSVPWAQERRRTGPSTLPPAQARRLAPPAPPAPRARRGPWPRNRD